MYLAFIYQHLTCGLEKGFKIIQNHLAESPLTAPLVLIWDFNAVPGELSFIDFG
jgi:hypothetical protein